MKAQLAGLIPVFSMAALGMTGFKTQVRFYDLIVIALLEGGFSRRCDKSSQARTFEIDIKDNA